MGITAEILAACEEAARQAGATRIERVRITVGELTEIVPDSLQFAWEALSPDTMAAGGVLEITETPGVSECIDCGVRFEHDRFDRHCEACGSFMTKVVAGNELRVDDIETDEPDPGAGEE